jgi:murein DD-endopeptidase MepM/ murein hydrolase activator NlpD
MTTPSKYVTIMLVPDGTETGKSWRVRRYVLQVAAVALGLTVLGIILFFVFYGTMVARTAMAERLRAENEELRRYRYKVKLLEDNLMQTREMVGRLTKMAGIDYQFPEIPPDSVLLEVAARPEAAVLSRSGTNPTIPSGMPVKGFVTRDFAADGALAHPGVDIGCAIGTPVLATAAGEVIFAGSDTTYGNMVIIKHSDSISTLYGHNDTLLVKAGDEIMVGGRIALSGNTGKSTAPHVHYEVRVHDKPIDPLENSYDQKTIQ